MQQLQNVPELVLPQIDPRANHVWHLFVIRTKQRDALKRYLSDSGVQTVINYPVALPFLEAYSYQENKVDDFPVAYQHHEEILSLPIFSDMTNDQIDYVAGKLENFLLNYLLKKCPIFSLQY